MNYRAHVFDCDGVLIDSNASKSEAFYRAGLPYGEDKARALVAYHQQAGSISRKARFQHFFTEILGREPEDGELEAVMATCARWVKQGALGAPKVLGVETFLARLAVTSELFVVSGVEQSELQEILDAHQLSKYFARIWSGQKTALLPTLIAQGDIGQPAIYYGDTEDDYLAARAAGMDFAFVSGCSEWAEGVTYLRDKPVRVIRDFVDREAAA